MTSGACASQTVGNIAACSLAGPAGLRSRLNLDPGHRILHVALGVADLGSSSDPMPWLWFNREALATSAPG